MASSHEFRPRRGKTPAKPRGARAALWIAVLVVLGVVLFFPVALATDRSTFCRTCHEMIPYYDAWLVGQHAKTAQCIDCHVDAGLPARFAHKFVALGEVKSHVVGDTSFPREQPADVPNKRCTRCHETLPKTAVDGFSHEIHTQKGTCATCHATTGHNVTVEVLKAVGIYNATAAPAPKSGAFAVVDRGKANVEGHKKIGCSRCHDMVKTGCPRCHTLSAAKHPWKGDCAQCHQPGEKFTFTHPSSADCQACHKPGEKHFRPVSGELPPCKTCHPTTGSAWKFSHPESGRRVCDLPQAACEPLPGPVPAMSPAGGRLLDLQPPRGVCGLRKLPQAACEPLPGPVLGVSPPSRRVVEVLAPVIGRALVEEPRLQDLPPQELHRGVLHLPRRERAQRLATPRMPRGPGAQLPRAILGNHREETLTPLSSSVRVSEPTIGAWILGVPPQLLLSAACPFG